MRRWLGFAAISAVVVVSFFSVSVSAEQRDRGLLITPPRQYLNVTPGETTKSSVTIANLTEIPLDVTLSVEQFSVTNLTYEYTFAPAKEKWISFETTQARLKKTESRVVPYVVNPPKNARPGGHYFTIFASANFGEGRVVRAATVLYLTAAGEITKNSAITEGSAPYISFGGDIPFQLDVKNTGNTHFIVYLSGIAKAVVPLASSESSEVAHVLLPETTRRLEGKMAPPVLPGLYQLRYGYRDEDGREVRQTRYHLYVPPWSLMVLAGGIWLVVLVWRRRSRLAERPSSTDS